MRKLLAVAAALLVVMGLGLAAPAPWALAQDTQPGFMESYDGPLKAGLKNLEFDITTGSLLLNDLAMTMDAEGQETLTVGQVEITGVEPDAFQALAGREQIELQKLADKIILSNIDISDPEGKLHIDTVTLVEPKLGYLPEGIETADEEAFFLEYLPLILQHLAVAEVSFDNLSVTPAGADKSMGGVARLSITNVDCGRVGAIQTDGFEGPSEDNLMSSVGLFKLENLDLTKLLEILTAEETYEPEDHLAMYIGSVGIGSYETANVKVYNPETGVNLFSLERVSAKGIADGRLESAEMANFVDNDSSDGIFNLAAARISNLDFSELVTMDREGKEISEKDIGRFALGEFSLEGLDVTTPDGDHVVLQKVGIGNIDHQGPMIKSATFDLGGLEVDVSKISDPQAKAMLESLGKDTISVSFKLDYLWDAATKKLELREVSLKAADLADLSLSLTIAGADFEKLETVDDAPMLLPALAVEKAEIRYEDYALAPKAMEMGAAMQGMTAEDLRAIAMASLEAFLSAPEQKPLVDGIGVFLSDPKKLVIEAAPAQPVPVLSLAQQMDEDPTGLLGMLNVSVVANDGEMPKVEAAEPAGTKPSTTITKDPAFVPAKPMKKKGSSN